MKKFSKADIRGILNRKRRWIFILFSFIAVRIVIFATFWQASIDKGGWYNFFKYTDLWRNALEYKELFRSLCGGLPLYFTYTSISQLFIDGQWGIYISQAIIALIFLYYVYKILKLYFSDKLVFLTIFFIAIDPYFAWYNFLIASGNLFALFLIVGVYYFLSFLKDGNRKHFMIFSVMISLAALTRTNGIFLSIVFSFLLVLFYLFKKFNLLEIEDFSAKKILMSVIFLNFTFLTFLLPVFLLNKIDHNDYRLDAAFSSNIYFFNVPVLHAHKYGISYSEAKNRLVEQANVALGFETGSLDCRAVGKDNYNKILDYADVHGKKYIKEDLFLYSKLHLFKMVPFFMQSGYYQMYKAYSGKNTKPDMTTAVLRGDISEIKNFILNINTGTVLYIGGILIWTLASLAVIFSAFYTFIKKKKPAPFFITALILILYTAFTVSPFSMPRYKIPLYPFFIISLLYMIQMIIDNIKNKKVILNK